METQHAPIHTLPAEVLRSIFEYAVYSPLESDCITPPFLRMKQPSSFIPATILSYVCRRWRIIALDAPRIWMYIGLDLHKGQEFINSYWDKALERARGAPLVVHIWIPHSSTYQSLPRHFNRMQCIDELTLVFAAKRSRVFLRPEDFINILHDDNFPIPQCPINKLVLSVQNGRTQFNLSKLLAKWPPVSWISIWATHSKIHLDETLPSYQTTHLDIHGISGFSLDILNKAFPVLQYLELLKLSLSVDTKVVTFDSLTHLTRNQHVYDLISSYMRCPNLTTLILQTDIEQKYILDFISSHTTIRALSTGDTLPLVDIAIAAPQLHTLSVLDSVQVNILYDWENTGLSSPPFPELQSLNIRSRVDEWRLEEFEALVRSRFLSSKHPESRLLPGLQRRMRSLILKYIVPNSSYPPTIVPEWKKSSLLQYAKIAGYHSSRGYYDAGEVTLEWPDVLDS